MKEIISFKQYCSLGIILFITAIIITLVWSYKLKKNGAILFAPIPYSKGEFLAQVCIAIIVYVYEAIGMTFSMECFIYTGCAVASTALLCLIITLGIIPWEEGDKK